MSKVEKELTDAEILEWATKELVIAEMSTEVNQRRRITENVYNNQFGYVYTGIKVYCTEGNSDITFKGEYPVNITRYPASNNRRIGYIAGVNSDGSFHMYILGNDTFDFTPTKATFTTGEYTILLDKVLLPPESEYRTEDTIQDYSWFSGIFNSYRNGQGKIGLNQTGNVSDVDSFEFNPTWFDVDFPARGFVDCTKYNDNYIASDQEPSIELQFNLTKNLDTLQLGCPITANYFQRSASHIYWGDKNIGGDLYDLLDSLSLSVNSGVRNLPLSVVRTSYELPGGGSYLMNNLYPWINASMAFHYTPYNLILTYDFDAAKNYVDTGELPGDAFLYPFDVDNIPVNADGGPGADDSDGTQDTVVTGDTTWEDTDDQSPSAPGQNGQSLTNNNLYWLTSQQLKSFLDWFWDEATDVTDPSELFEKIQGLYENLSEAIVAVRYMPVRPEWIGGVASDTKIIVGMLEKTETVRVINKVVPDIQTIGSIDIRELAKDNKTWDGFLNYSPYCQMSLYLPFHGFIDLDADLIMNSRLTIKAAYDILTGTIQYFIYRTARGANNLNLVNTVVAKMATDIPISLQTKTQRDSAIFQNVSSAAGNLIGAGASLATGNPIGMVMSTANIAAAQPMGAPLTLKGTISENGAYYDSALCAIYVKRPGINIPSNYDRKVGNPCNVAMKLSQVHGFVKCENPFISFSEVTSDNSLGFPPPKPTKDEIDTIYNALSEGVILP